MKDKILANGSSFFGAIACHKPLKPVLRGFEPYFQASVHFPVTSAVNKAQQHLNKFLRMPRIENGPTW